MLKDISKSDVKVNSKFVFLKTFQYLFKSIKHEHLEELSKSMCRTIKQTNSSKVRHSEVRHFQTATSA